MSDNPVKDQIDADRYYIAKIFGNWMAEHTRRPGPSVNNAVKRLILIFDRIEQRELESKSYDEFKAECARFQALLKLEKWKEEVGRERPAITE